MLLKLCQKVDFETGVCVCVKGGAGLCLRSDKIILSVYSLIPGCNMHQMTQLDEKYR